MKLNYNLTTILKEWKYYTYIASVNQFDLIGLTENWPPHCLNNPKNSWVKEKHKRLTRNYLTELYNFFLNVLMIYSNIFK